MNPVLLEVLEERHRQDQRWGQQNHPAEVWTQILGEEFGEVCNAALAARFAAFDAEESRVSHEEWALGLRNATRSELLQVAACAVAWVQAIDREGV